MGSCEEFRNDGWYISKDSYNVITDNGTLKDRRSIIDNALNTDIKEFGEPVLSGLLKQGKTGKVVLQIQKIRNVSAPKSKEDSQAAPRMLKLILTDGHTSCQAIEILNLSSLSRNFTPPGSKLLINNAKIFSNCILLQPNHCTLLGGKVPLLFERWELAKNMSEHIRASVGSDGPPPWVNFGEKIISLTSNEPFKSLASKTTKETTNEFDVHRQDAIANATSGAVKKVFGGGVRIAQDNHLTNLKRGNNFSRANYENQNTQEHSRGYKNRRENKEKVVNEKPQKPAEKISLFDFLENKLVVNENDNKSKNRSVDIETTVQKMNAQYKEFQRNQNYSGFQQPNYPGGGFHQQNYSGSGFHQQNYSGGGFHQQNYPRSGYHQNQNYSRPTGNNFNKSSQYNINNTTENRNRNTTNNDAATTNAMETMTKNFGKVSIDSQFASRSLQQHLNLVKNDYSKPKVNNPSQNWKVGDLCMAKYWEDGKFYNATITNLTERTCVVQFNGYGNVEEVLKTDCLPANSQGGTANKSNPNYRGNNPGYYNNRRTFSNSHSHNFKGT